MNNQNQLNEKEVRYLEDLMRKAFAGKRELIIQKIRKALFLAAGSQRQPRSGQNTEYTNSGASENQKSDQQWLSISSLSQLRAEVGGRFQNLRSRWLGAGFPLKEHKGDSNCDFSLDNEGWLELTNWVTKQGYEIRLSSDEATHFFEIRKI